MADLFDDLVYVGMVGSRRRDAPSDYTLAERAFFQVYVPNRTVLVSGGCPEGGDRFAEVIAKKLGLPRQHLYSRVSRSGPTEGPRIIIHYPDVEAFLGVPARWRKTQANYARNAFIAEDSRDHLIAVVADDRSGGTENTIKSYRKLWKREPILA